VGVFDFPAQTKSLSQQVGHRGIQKKRIKQRDDHQMQVELLSWTGSGTLGGRSPLGGKQGVYRLRPRGLGLNNRLSIIWGAVKK